MGLHQTQKLFENVELSHAHQFLDAHQVHHGLQEKLHTESEPPVPYWLCKNGIKIKANIR